MKRSSSATGTGWPSLAQTDGWACALATVTTASSRAALDRAWVGGVRFTVPPAAFLQWTTCSQNSQKSPTTPALLQSLNTEQRAAVTLPNTHALILAGAGSGKTRVLTTRIAWLMQTGQISPGGVLAVTFTNKAAKEMMTRLGAMLPVNVRGMWIGTFHGLCNRFLRAHYKAANLPQSFQILDTQDQLSAIKRLMKQFGIDDERYPAKKTLYFIAGCKEDGQRPGMVHGARRRHTQAGGDLPAVRRPVPARGRGGLWRADAAQLRGAARQRAGTRNTTSGVFATS